MSALPNRPRVAVVTDSTSGLSGAQLPNLEAVRIVPLLVQRGERDFHENVDITGAEVLSALQSGEVLTTSRPAPDEFAAVYQELAAAGYEAAVSLHLSAKLSGTYDAAVTAAKTAPIPVEVVDSKTAGMILGFGANAAVEACQASAEPASVKNGESAAAATARHMAKIATEVMERARVLFYVDTLEFLHRGGRIGSISALLGTALAVKPLLTVADGHIELSEKVRTRRRALERLVARTLSSGRAILDDVPAVDIALQHLGAPRAGEEALRQITAGLGAGVRNRVLTDAGAVVGAHVGPGVVAAIVAPVMHE